MMKTKKVAYILLALTLLLVACSSNSGSSSKGGKVIRFATDATYAPMEYMDKDKVVGFDVDFLDAVMKEAKLEYTLTHTGWETMLESVKQGAEYDAGISSVSITDERKETYEFSLPYFESTNMILTKEGSPIKSALDLKDKKVAVQSSTTADIIMTEMMGIDNTNLKKFESNATAILELENNGVDAVVADNMIVGEYIKNNPDSKLVGLFDTENFTGEFYGIAFPKNTTYKDQIDKAIKTVLENGTYKDIYKKWFGQEPDMTNLLP